MVNEKFEVSEIEEESSENEGPENEESIEPFDPKLIDIGVETKSLDSLVARLKNNEIDMNTEFQRHADLWEPKKMSRLIESILIRFPLPAFYFDGSDESNWLVVDGLQRLSSIRKFVIQKEMKLSGLEFLTNLNGQTYEQLDRMYQRRIDECNVVTYVIKPGTPEDVKYSIFRRVNTGGLTLNNQEVRNAMARPQEREFLLNLSQDETLKIMIGDLSKRMQDQELVLRFIAFLILDRSKVGQIANFLDQAMTKLKENDSQLQTQINGMFLKAINLCHYFLGDRGFDKNPSVNKRITSALFEVWMVTMARLEEQEIQTLRENKEKFSSLKDMLYADNNFLNSVSVSTQKREHVQYRYEQVQNLIKECINA